MGTIVHLTLIGEDSEASEGILNRTLDQMQELEGLCSRHDPGTQLSMLNREGVLEDPDPSLLDLFEQAAAISRATAGAFDVTVKPLMDIYEHIPGRHQNPKLADALTKRVPLIGYEGISLSPTTIRYRARGMQSTLDGIAKGYIIDQAVRALRGAGFPQVLVEAGGDLYAAGKAQRRPWRVGLQAPRSEAGSLLGSFGIQDRALATSGDYIHNYSADFMQHHILDPRTGFSSRELASVTVLAPTATQADGLSTALMVMAPEEGQRLVEALPNVEALFVTKAQRLRGTGGFPELTGGLNGDPSA
jgi:thiamine biosynthesis lipoprotein